MVCCVVTTSRRSTTHTSPTYFSHGIQLGLPMPMLEGDFESGCAGVEPKPVRYVFRTLGTNGGRSPSVHWCYTVLLVCWFVGLLVPCPNNITFESRTVDEQLFTVLLVCWFAIYVAVVWLFLFWWHLPCLWRYILHFMINVQSLGQTLVQQPLRQTLRLIHTDLYLRIVCFAMLRTTCLMTHHRP